MRPCIPSCLIACAVAIAALGIQTDASGIVPSTPSCPQLTSDVAKDFTAAKYLAQAGTLDSLKTDNWNPNGVGKSSKFKADFVVDPTNSKAFQTVQAAIDAATKAGGSRKFISIAPGTYKEVLCVPISSPPITLYGLDRNASSTTIVFDNAAGTPKPVGVSTHPCNDNSASSTVGTFASATVTVFGDDFQARDLTFLNSYVEGTFPKLDQAVALSVRGDKAIFDNVRVLGNQDTLFLGGQTLPTVTRAYFTRSFIQGDVDFIFGFGTAVFDHSTIDFTAIRKRNSNSSFIFAPSTQPKNPYGFLAVACKFTASDGPGLDYVHLARAWDQSVPALANYTNDVSPNGQVLVRNSLLGDHVLKAAPWGVSTVKRPYCSEQCQYSPNRFFEYKNQDLTPSNATATSLLGLDVSVGFN